jgi:uncharacterized delta-60 repeat protein
MSRMRHQTVRRMTSTSILEPLEGRQLMAAGDLDKSFAGAGWTTAFFGNGLQAVAEDVAVQADGKTVVAGYAWYFDTSNRPHRQLAVARFNVNGSLDKTFGPDRSGMILTQVADTDTAQGRSVAIQADGKIVVAGAARSGNNGVMAVVRYNTNGSLDNTFDTDGRVTVRLNSSSAWDLALQKDGKIVVVGEDYSSPNDDFAAIRLNPNGALDRTFDGDGKMTVKMGANERAMAVAIDYSGTRSSNSNYGKIILVGEYRTDNFQQYAIARLTTAGNLDNGFAVGGWTRAGFKGQPFSRARGVVVQSNGKIVIAGTGGNPNNFGSFQFMLARFDKKGKLDPIFGDKGVAETGFGGTDEAYDVIISADDGLLVGGAVSRKLALAKYNSIGQLDTRFGKGGKAGLEVGDIQAGAGIASTGDGRVVLAGGTGFITARFSQGLPKIDIINGDREAGETPGDDGSLLIMRDASYDFATRVYLNISGNATIGADYTTTLARELPVLTQGLRLGGKIGGIGGGVLGTGRYFVDIPAGQSQVLVTVNPIDDRLFEGNESTLFAIAPSDRYEIGSFKDRVVTIADNDSMGINFAPAGSTEYAGYALETGRAFGPKLGGASFGWDADNTANVRQRNSAGSPDARYDTYNHMQKNGANRKWEIAVPNGMYTVRLVAGDAEATDSVHHMSLEGQMVLSGTPTGDVRWFRSTTNVLVTDGRLTLTNAAGAVNNKIAFLDIKAAGLREAAGPKTGTLPVRLYGPGTASLWHRTPNGTFADNQIDEPLWA